MNIEHFYPYINTKAGVATMYIRDAGLGVHPEADMIVMLNAIREIADKRQMPHLAQEISSLMDMLHDDFVNIQTAEERDICEYERDVL